MRYMPLWVQLVFATIGLVLVACTICIVLAAAIAYVLIRLP